MAPSLIKNPQAVDAVYELLELDCTGEEVKELFEYLQVEVLNGPGDEDIECQDYQASQGIQYYEG